MLGISLIGLVQCGSTCRTYLTSYMDNMKPSQLHQFITILANCVRGTSSRSHVRILATVAYVSLNRTSQNSHSRTNGLIADVFQGVVGCVLEFWVNLGYA